MDWIKQHRGLFLFEGILVVLFGILAIAIPQIFTLGVTLFIGWLLIFSGIVQGFRAWKGMDREGFWPTLFSSILNIVVGILLITHPIAGIITLTLLLSVFFLLEGISKIYYALELKPHYQWGWLFFSGVLALILATIIIGGLPETSTWVIGLLFGINMLFTGIAMIAVATSIKPDVE